MTAIPQVVPAVWRAQAAAMRAPSALAKLVLFEAHQSA